MKIVSQLNSEGYFVAAVVADESPLEPGVFLIPGGAVDAYPPIVPAGKRLRHNAGSWIAEDIPVPSSNDEQQESPEATPVPICTPWQIRKALNALGLRQQIEDAVAASEVAEIRDGWEFASVFRSDDPFVIGMGSAIGKTDTEVAEIIQYASTL